MIRFVSSSFNNRCLSVSIRGSTLLARIFFFFLDVRAAFSTGKAGPHSFGSPIQAVVVIRAGEIADPFALLAHHRIRGVLIHSLGLNGLSSSAFFLRHEQKLLIYTPSPTGSAQNNNAKSRYGKSRASLLCCKPIIIFYIQNLTRSKLFI